MTTRHARHAPNAYLLNDASDIPVTHSRDAEFRIYQPSTGLQRMSDNSPMNSSFEVHPVVSPNPPCDSTCCHYMDVVLVWYFVCVHTHPMGVHAFYVDGSSITITESVWGPGATAFRIAECPSRTWGVWEKLGTPACCPIRTEDPKRTRLCLLEL